MKHVNPDLPGTGPVKLTEKDTLPGAKLQMSIFNKDHF
jgi:hypothetical protein